MGLGTSISRAILYNRKDIIPRAPAHSLCPSSALIHNARHNARPFLHFTAVAVEFENRMCVPASSAPLPLSRPLRQRRIKSYLEIVIVLRRRDPFVRNRTAELAGNCCPRKERKRITPYSSPLLPGVENLFRYTRGRPKVHGMSSNCHPTSLIRH